MLNSYILHSNCNEFNFVLITYIHLTSIHDFFNKYNERIYILLFV